MTSTDAISATGPVYSIPGISRTMQKVAITNRISDQAGTAFEATSLPISQFLLEAHCHQRGEASIAVHQCA